MGTTAVKETRAKVHRFSTVKTVRQQTFEEWLAEEANAGRMILAVSAGNTPLPVKPKETADFWDAYNETRADRF